eukprot:ctg_1175.g380
MHSLASAAVSAYELCVDTRPRQQYRIQPAANRFFPSVLPRRRSWHLLQRNAQQMGTAARYSLTFLTLSPSRTAEPERSITPRTRTLRGLTCLDVY